MTTENGFFHSLNKIFDIIKRDNEIIKKHRVLVHDLPTLMKLHSTLLTDPSDPNFDPIEKVTCFSAPMTDSTAQNLRCRKRTRTSWILCKRIWFISRSSQKESGMGILNGVCFLRFRSHLTPAPKSVLYIDIWNSVLRSIEPVVPHFSDAL